MTQIQALSYAVVQSTRPGTWQHFGEQVLGMAATEAGADLWLKMDERRFRIAVVPASEDRYFASGWEVADASAFSETLAALERAGVAVEMGDAALCRARCVSRLASFADPAGNRHEVSFGHAGGAAPFVSPIGVSGFKTGAQGLGHTVLPALPFEATLAFFCEVLGFGLSDKFNFKPAPEAPAMRIYFLHAASGRHHSLALAEMPNPAGCVHLMVEVNTMAEVGRAEERRRAAGVKLMATLGQHENDRMTSFYMMTPGNFAIEYGWGGISVDPATHRTTETQRISIWGHDFSVGFQA